MPAVLEPAATGDAYQVRVVGTQEGAQTNNVLHFVSASGTADVETTLVAVMADCFVDNILPALSADWQLLELRWKKVSPTLGIEHIFTPSGAPLAGSAGEAFPSYVSGLTSIRTAEGGRSKRGRMFLAGIPQTAANKSSLDTGNAFWTALVAWLACITTNFIHTGLPGSNQWNLSVYSRKIGGSTMPFGASGFTAVTNLVANVLLATTRSRKLGVGA
jgi:hypothetical protein